LELIVAPVTAAAMGFPVTMPVPVHVAHIMAIRALIDDAVRHMDDARRDDVTRRQ
jgi:hypothetical protein